MISFHVFSLTLLLSLPLPLASRIETAFLQNSPGPPAPAPGRRRDHPRLPARAPGSRRPALPGPGVSSSSSGSSRSSGRPSSRPIPGCRPGPASPGGILKARWSFRNDRTGNQYPLRVYFFVVPARLPAGPGARGPGMALRIVEIRAEKL
ncbi:MAG: hypothetical protein M0C28_35765 [Candidatus Moduliflexus flocculans]|nr:hypothetical protein [Candidatus Moduliflexus flocculans]